MPNFDTSYNSEKGTTRNKTYVTNSPSVIAISVAENGTKNRLDNEKKYQELT